MNESKPVIVRELLDDVTPFFFQNKWIGRTVFLAKTTYSLSNAVHLIQFFNKEGYIPSSENYSKIESTIGNIKLNLYSYNSPDDINRRVIIIGQESFSEEYNVLVYKSNDTLSYVALIPTRYDNEIVYR